MSTQAISGVSINDKNLEKQMSGCMSGFFNIFDRSHILSGKRHYPKRLPPPPPASDSESEAVPSGGFPALSREFEKPKIEPQQPELRSTTPEKNSSPATPPPKSPSPATPWKFSREAPRLSLDSRAVTDGKGGLRPREIGINKVSKSGNVADDDVEERENHQLRSPSVIARLMGLEPLPSSAGVTGSGEPGPEKKSELRRSASESRSRDYRFVDSPSFLSPCNYESAGERKLDGSVVNRQQNDNNNDNNNNSKTRNRNQCNNNNNNNNQRRLMVERRSYYDTTDLFPPEIPTKQQYKPVTIYGEIERRLKTKGIDEMSKDRETLKHILEAMQLKGLLHSSSTSAYDRRFFQEESPIVLMKPARPPSLIQTRRRTNNVSSGEPGLSPRKERSARSVTRSPGRGENSSSSPSLRRKGGPLSLETTRRGNETTTIRSSHSPVQSPRLTKRSDNQTVNRSPRSRKPSVETYQRRGPTFAEDEVSTVSASSFSTSSYTDNERWRVEEYNDGKNLLERCGKLLHNIAEITAKSSSNSNSAELQQPSPVSVLDSSFYKEDESSPSPVKKRTIDFKDHGVIDLEEELWTPISSPTELPSSSENSEFNYVSEVIRASNYLPDDENLFFLLEKQSSNRGIGRDVSKVSVLERKLTFDTITEILDRNRQLPAWTAGTNVKKRSILEEIWSEFKNIRELDPSEDLLEVICGVWKKDLTRDSITGWSDFSIEMSDAVLAIERLIFKDIIGETIRDLATLARKTRGMQSLCRKLVF